MAATTTLTSCPKCGQKCRIATAKGTVHITCPKCATQWDWPPSTSAGAAVWAKWRQPTRRFWRVAFLQPRLSYAGSVAFLLAGFGLGVYLERGGRAPASARLPGPLASTNLPSAVHPGAPSGAHRPAGPAENLPIESLLPSNGVDFNEPLPPGANLPPPK